MEEMKYYASVIDVLRLEANKIEQVSRQLDINKVNEVVELLLNCKGKVITIGIGKSGFIAKKFAATLTSIGTGAIYLHPSDAMHGDLGIASSSDIAIVISNGGESQEVLNLIPYLKARGISIISLVGNLESTLAQMSDIVLNTEVDREADEYNLVPSASTTVALALTDGLALTVMKEKRIKPKDFAFNHPSGRLGKRLTLRVSDLMHCESNNPIVKHDYSWYQIIQAISDGGLGAVNVINENKELLGIITDGDIRRVLGKKSTIKFETLTSKMIMTKNPVTVNPKTLAYDAMNIMESRSSQISVLPVVETNNICVGMIRLHDIVRSGL